MKFLRLLVLTLISAAVSGQTLSPTQTAAPVAGGIDELVGFWKAKVRYGPDAQGTLIIQKAGVAYFADMMGRRVPVRMDQGELIFDLPNNQGTFRGRVDRKNILGHWFRPRTPANGENASLVVLAPDGPGCWRGNVVPLQDTLTFYLMVEKRPDGTIGILLRNPERDFGNLLGVQRLTREGNVIKLIGKRRGQKDERDFSPEHSMLKTKFSRCRLWVAVCARDRYRYH